LTFLDVTVCLREQAHQGNGGFGTMSKRVNLVGLALAMMAAGTTAAQTNTFPPSGNVGIGTTNPGYSFEVAGSGGSFVATDLSGSASNPVTTERAQSPTSTASGNNEQFVWYINEDANWVPAHAMSLWQYPSDSLGGCCHQHAIFGINSSGNNYQYFSGNVGIGATTPQYPLEVNGSIKLDAGSLIFPDGTSLNSSSMTVQGPQSGLVVSGANLGGYTINGSTTQTSALPNTGNLLLGWNLSGGGGEQDFIANRGAGGTGGFRFYDESNSGNMTSLLTLLGNGNVGIGTTSPLYLLDVAGQIRSSAGGYVFPDGSTQTTAFIPANCGADFAESVGVTGSRPSYEPGDLMVIDPDAPGKFLKSNEAYSTLVAGIYSTKPGFVGRFAPADPKAKDTEVPMAMVGRGPTKVSAENGPIKVGDLLVASSTPGYAMKGTDRNRMFGAVVGKALAPLDSATGVIEVLVTLQ
jgi:hypothetical protein